MYYPRYRNNLTGLDRLDIGSWPRFRIRSIRSLFDKELDYSRSNMINQSSISILINSNQFRTKWTNQFNLDRSNSFDIELTINSTLIVIDRDLNDLITLISIEIKFDRSRSIYIDRVRVNSIELREFWWQEL